MSALANPSFKESTDSGLKGSVQSSMSKKKEIDDQLCQTPLPPKRKLEQEFSEFIRAALHQNLHINRRPGLAGVLV